MTDQDRLEMWERYQNDQMDQEEKTVFLDLTKKDPQWRAWIQRYHLVIDAIEWKIENELRDEMQRWPSPGSKQPVKSRFHQMLTGRWMLVAAATLLFMIMIPYWYGKTNYSKVALAAKYYPLPLSSTTRTGDETTDARFEAGLRAFALKEWEMAINHFESITSDTEHYVEAQLLLGHASYHAGQFDRAIEIFQEIQNSQSIYEQTAEWMIVLTRLRSKDEEDAIASALTPILDDRGHSFYDQALRLQEDLENFWRKIN